MKKGILTLLCLVVLKLSYAQFYKCHSVTVESNLYDVHFVDENVGVVVGDQGTILRTVDGGLNWEQVMANEDMTFKKVAFFDNQTGIVVGSHIFKTTDGGKTWKQLDLFNDEFYDISILDDATCVVTGAPRGVQKSTDRGESWKITIGYNDRFYDRDYAMMSFVNENVGYTMANRMRFSDYAFKTVDGGQSWDTVYQEKENPFTVLSAIQFVDENKGFRGGWYSSVFEQTNNGGRTWEEVEWMSLGGILDIYIDEEKLSTYYACGPHGGIYQSKDQGQVWTQVELEQNIPQGLNAIYFVNESAGWAVGNDGVILSTQLNRASCKKDPEDLDFLLSPNPTTGLVRISNPYNIKLEDISLLNIEGKLIKALRINVNTSQVSLEGLPRGVYFIRVLTEYGEIAKKIILQ